MTHMLRRLFAALFGVFDDILLEESSCSAIFKTFIKISVHGIYYLDFKKTDHEQKMHLQSWMDCVTLILLSIWAPLEFVSLK